MTDSVSPNWPVLIGPNYMVRERLVHVLLNSVEQLVGPDLRRVLVAFATHDVNTDVISTTNTPDLASGHYLTASLKDSLFTFTQHGALSQAGWYVACSITGSFVQVIEVFYDPH